MATAVDAVLADAGVPHVAHGDGDPVAAGVAAAEDPAALAMIGPVFSAAVAETVEATAPAGLALIAPLATWAGVTRDDEPGCEDAARHRGTVLRMVARDTVVAQRIARALGQSGERALVVAGDHDYGRQLDGQLALAGLRRVDGPGQADLIVLAGLAGAPEIERAAALPELPVIAFDGVQGADLGKGRDIRLALPFAPAAAPAERRAAELVVGALGSGAGERAAVLDELRRLGSFDEHGDPVDPPVWLWRADDDWAVEPDRAL